MQVSIKDAAFEVQDQPADFWGWVKAGHYDREWNLIATHLRPEHTFLDLGAWVGSHSLYASTIAKRVIAFEPDPVAWNILKDNLLLKRHKEGRNNIEAWEVAVTDHTGVIELGSGLLGASTTRANPIAGGGMGPWEDGQRFWSKCATLSNLTDKLKLEDPLFIKMDVEGSEEDILEDLDFFREHKPILFLEQHPWWWKDEAATRELIKQISECCTVLPC